jgi:hypothetical protein
MSTIWTLLRVTAILGGLTAALLTGGIAHADPAQPVPIPDLGGIGGQLASVAANAPQALQNAGTALGVLPPPKPIAPPPLAGASITVPQPGSAAVPAAPAAPALPGTTAGIPGVTSPVPGAPAVQVPQPLAVPGTTAAAPATGPGQLLPQGQLKLPQVPFRPVPLPQQVSLPGDLASLAPCGVPIPRGVVPTGPAVAAPAAAAAAPTNPLLIPLPALP